MTPAEILSRLGSMADLARETGISHQSLYGYRTRNAIPSHHMLAVLLAAEQRGLPITARDIIETHAVLKASKPKRSRSADPTIAARNAEILARSQANESHADIAHDYRMTRERVRQIVQRLGGLPARQGQKVRKTLRMADRKSAMADKAAARRDAKLTRVRERIEARLQGLGVEAVAARFRVTVSSIMQDIEWAERQPEFADVAHLLRARVPVKSYRRVTLDELAKITQMRNAGASQNVIARTMGRSQPTISKLLHRIGAP